MRGNSEDTSAFNQHFKSGKFSHSSLVMTGDVRITTNGSLVNSFDPNGSDRTVELPPLEAGRFYAISHVGSANNLNIVTSTAALVLTLIAGETVILFSSETEWKGIKAGFDLSDFGIAGPGHKHGLVPDPGPTPAPDPSHRKYLSELGWAEITEITGDDFYKYFKGGATTLTPLGADTLEFLTANSILTILANAATTPDSVLFTINQGNIDHNALLNYVADRHIAHSGVTLTAGNGLAGGGDITASRTFDLDLNDLTTDTPVLADLFGFYDVSGADTNKATLTVLNGILDHNALLNYSANRHIDHTGVSIIAGVGLTGGGDITTSRTLALDINGLTTDTIAVGDFFPFYDISGVDTNKITLANLNAALDHNSLLNYVANQHIDHTTVSISTAANSGLAGGGTIAATRSLTVDVNNLTADTPVLGDSFAFYDLSGLDTNKSTFTILNGILDHNALLNYVANQHIDHTAVSISTTEGIQGGGTIAATRTLKLDVNTLTADATPDITADYVATWDASASLHKKVLLQNLKTQNAAAIEFIIDGAGATITTGLKGFLEVPFACNITMASLLADQSGSIVVNVWKDTYANFPPTVADKITASAPPTITTATKSQDSTLTGWTVACALGDILAFNVDSVTTIQRVTLSLRVNRT